MKLNDADVAGPFFRVSAVKEEGGGERDVSPFSIGQASRLIYGWIDLYLINDPVSISLNQKSRCKFGKYYGNILRIEKVNYDLC